jgi:hypothetical protein
VLGPRPKPEMPSRAVSEGRRGTQFGKQPTTVFRACLVSNKVGLGGADLAPPTPRTELLTGCFYRVASSVFEAFLPKRAIRDRPSAYARLHKRYNPHLYQTGSQEDQGLVRNRPLLLFNGWHSCYPNLSRNLLWRRIRRSSISRSQLLVSDSKIMRITLL